MAACEIVMSCTWVLISERGIQGTEDDGEADVLEDGFSAHIGGVSEAGWVRELEAVAEGVHSGVDEELVEF